MGLKCYLLKEYYSNRGGRAQRDHRRHRFRQINRIVRRSGPVARYIGTYARAADNTMRIGISSYIKSLLVLN